MQSYQRRTKALNMQSKEQENKKQQELHLAFVQLACLALLSSLSREALIKKHVSLCGRGVVTNG
jgi:hypothetical protein